MKVEPTEKGIIVTPETDFEADYLRQRFNLKELLVFLKSGMSASETIGLKMEGAVDK